MIVNASSDAPLSAGTLVLVTCFSALVLITGVRHYRGHGTWLLPWLPTQASFFGSAWYGAFGLMVVLCDLAERVSVVLVAVLAIPTFGLGLIALVSLFWLPSRLLPGWYRDRRRRSHPRAARAIR